MAGTALPRRLAWHAATVRAIETETPRVRTLHFDCPEWPGHLAGQHVDVRLTAPDGYQAQRSYSIATAPEDPGLALTVERLEEGEVSTYLVDELRPGDAIEIRGPIGGYFVWTEELGGPVNLLAGGSGIVPLRAMLRHHRAIGSRIPMALLYSARTLGDVIYREELERAPTGRPVRIAFTLTRERTPDWTGHRRRVDRAMLEAVTHPADARPLNYICGPTAFVEVVASTLVELGHEPERVRTERFGPTGEG